MPNNHLDLVCSKETARAGMVTVTETQGIMARPDELVLGFMAWLFPHSREAESVEFISVRVGFGDGVVRYADGSCWGDYMAAG
jgi:hypothetical protein